jgi:hypothetical protein
VLRLPAIRGKSFTIACDAPWHFDDQPKRRRKAETITVRPSAWQAMMPRRH